MAAAAVAAVAASGPLVSKKKTRKRASGCSTNVIIRGSPTLREAHTQKGWVSDCNPRGYNLILPKVGTLSPTTEGFYHDEY